MGRDSSTHTLAESYMPNTSLIPGGVAKMAANRKVGKYACIAQSYIFQPLAFETLGPVNESGQIFLNELGRRISLVTGDLRSATFLFQRISVTIQCFNAVAFAVLLLYLQTQTRSYTLMCF